MPKMPGSGGGTRGKIGVGCANIAPGAPNAASGGGPSDLPDLVRPLNKVRVPH